MYFTKREKIILGVLLDYPNGVNQQDLQDILGVSKRTVYRELANIEDSVAQFHLTVVKPRNDGYYLEGSEEDKQALYQALHQTPFSTFSKAQRQNALALTFLMQDQVDTIDAIAADYKVSERTLSTDLAMIRSSFAEYGIEFQTDRNGNQTVVGDEIILRQLIVNLLDLNIKEYEFFQLMKAKDFAQVDQEDYFLQLVPSAIYQLIHHIFNQGFAKDQFAILPDNQLKTIIISFAVNILRIEQGHEIESEILAKGQSAHFIRLSHQLYELVAKNRHLAVSMNERHFFARQLEGMNFNKRQNIFSQNFNTELSYQVAELTRRISNQTGYDFRQDNTLYEDLMTHLNAALKRVDQGMVSIDDNILDKITSKYPNLHAAVGESLKEVFPAKNFNNEEIAYIVIHYASSIERQPISSNIKVVILTAGGFGTSKILEGRFKNKIPEIQNLEIYKISQMDTIKFNEVDLILSTSYLPGFDYNYKVISPLLLDDEIMSLRQEVKNLSQMKSGGFNNDRMQMRADERFDKLFRLVNSANQILENFDIVDVVAGDSVEETLLAIVKDIDATIVSDPEMVTDKVIHRYLEAPIGIPHSNIALFHSTNQWVQAPFFKIYQLDKSFSILGMDKEPIDLERILLLLAPEPLSDENEILLGKISSSIIDNDLNTEIYKSGTKGIVFQLLSSLFVEETTRIE
ncbi:PRD domain-containing protein [Aerococcus agrisoli]|uniref:PRD domain-containing protein n=1 Tax=Aerococcus agrisoli TaxID=2487350 RepID=A0A3N4GCC5_9LACT|nr:BglG family transcription antiterminator [Aerococcus agrisoli]RPA60459.1 PRD domain-containing protein [Aerococcus agrisoli]